MEYLATGRRKGEESGNGGEKGEKEPGTFNFSTLNTSLTANTVYCGTDTCMPLSYPLNKS